MIALDTSIVVRLLVDDDPQQAARARKLLEGSAVLLPTTVVLECEWVLRGAYGFKAKAIAGAFRKLFGLSNVKLVQPAAVLAALAAYEQGLDFADALHLTGTGGATGFATFDRALKKRATVLSGMLPVLVP